MAEGALTIPTTVESIMKIGGTAGSLFSIGFAIYGSIETSKYRKEVISKLNSLLEGQKTIESLIKQDIADNHITQFENKLSLDKFNELITYENQYLGTDGINASAEQFSQFFTSVRQSKLPEQYSLYLSNFLNDLYVILIPNNTRKDHSVSSLTLFPNQKTLMEYVCTNFFVQKHDSGEIYSNVGQYLEAYYTSTVAVLIVKALQLLHYAQKDTSLSAADLSLAKKRYTSQIDAWYKNHPNPNSENPLPPRLQELADFVQTIFDGLSSDDNSWGQKQNGGYNDDETKNLGYISYDTVYAPSGNVIVGWELSEVSNSDHSGNGIKIYYGKINENTGFIDSEILQAKTGTNTFEKTGGWLSSATTLSTPKTWTTTRMQAAKQIVIKIQTPDGKTEEAVIYWGIVALNLSEGSCNYTYTDGNGYTHTDKVNYLALHSMVKPIVFYNNQHILVDDISFNGGTTDRSSTDYNYWHTVKTSFSNKPQFETGGPFGCSYADNPNKVMISGMPITATAPLQPMTRAYFDTFDKHDGAIFAKSETVPSLRMDGDYSSFPQLELKLSQAQIEQHINDFAKFLVQQVSAKLFHSGLPIYDIPYNS